MSSGDDPARWRNAVLVASWDDALMAVMSELPAGDTHDVIHHGGAVVAVVLPIAEYQQLRWQRRSSG
jgi:hypothetical protein